MPYAVGIFTEKQYPRIINRINNPPLITAKLIHFHRGWFSSTAKVQYKIKMSWPQIHGKPYFPDNIVAFSTNETIKHGPLIFLHKNNKTKLVIAKAIILSQTHLPHITFNTETTWALTNKLICHIHSTNITINNAQQQLRLAGLKSTISYKPSNKKIRLAIHLDEGDLHHKKLLYVQNLEAIANFQYIEHMWYGTRQLSADKLSFITPNHRQILINGLRMQTTQQKQNNLTQINFAYANKKLIGDNLNLGPVNLELSFNGLNSAALMQFVNKSFAVDAQHLSNEQQFTILYKPFLDLVSKGFNLQINKLFIHTASGPVHGFANLIIPKQDGKMSLNYLIFNTQAIAYLQAPRDWLTTFLANFLFDQQAKKLNHKSINRNELAKQQINQWVNNNWLLQQSNKLTFKLQYQGGHLLINDTFKKQTKLHHSQPHITHQLLHHH